MKQHETIIVVLCTDENGNTITAGKTIEGDRDWAAVFADCASAIVSNDGKVYEIGDAL